MFYTFLKKLTEIESRIKQLERAYFYLVNDYTSPNTERPSAVSILERQNHILQEIDEQAKAYIATHRELESLVEEATQETEAIASELETLLNVEISFSSTYSDENQVLSESPSPTIFITRNSCIGNQNAETPAVRRFQPRTSKQ